MWSLALFIEDFVLLFVKLTFFCIFQDFSDVFKWSFACICMVYTGFNKVCVYSFSILPLTFKYLEQGAKLYI